MPIRQAKGKWYWGTQGPFDSKKKAQEVAKAAHSSGYTKKSSDQASPGSRPMDNLSPLTADEMNRKLRRATRGGKEVKEVLQKYGVQDFGNPQEDALKRGAEKPAGWKRNNAHVPQKDETSMDKLTAFVKFDQQRSTNHPAYPSTFQGKLGAKRIDWRKKKDPNFEKHTRVGTPTDSVHQSSMDTNLVLAKDMWLQKFMDVSKQRVIAYILKAAEEEEPKKEKPPDEGESTESEERTPAEETVGKPVTVAGALRWDTSRMGPMPSNRIEVASADEVPKGTRLIEGPRGGLYYIGDPTQNTDIEHPQYGIEFDKLRGELIEDSTELVDAAKTLANARQRVVSRVTQRILEAQETIRNRDTEPFPDVIEEYKGELIPVNAALYDALFRNFVKSTPEYIALLQEQADAENKFKELQKQVEPKQVKAMNSLLGLMQHLPQVMIGSEEIDNDSKYQIQMSPNLQLVVDSNGVYSNALRDYLRRDALIDYLDEKSNPIRKLTAEDQLSPEQASEFQKRFLDIYQAQILDKNLGAIYLSEENADTQNKWFAILNHKFGDAPADVDVPKIFEADNVFANPHEMKNLFEGTNEGYLRAVHILTHESIHSANTFQTEGNFYRRTSARLKSFVHPTTGTVGTFNDLITHPDISRSHPMYNELMEDWHDGTRRFQLFRSEAHTELMTQLVMNQNYADPSEPRSAATKEDAIKMTLPGGDHAGGYNDTMPVFCRWLLMQNDNSPLKAREYFMKSFKGFHESSPVSINTSLLDYLHFQAVGSISHMSLALASDARLAKIRDEGGFPPSHISRAKRRMRGFVTHYGHLNSDKWADGDKRRGQGKQDIRDFLNYNTDVGAQNIQELKSDPPSLNDIKWFLYGERN